MIDNISWISRDGKNISSRTGVLTLAMRLDNCRIYVMYN